MLYKVKHSTTYAYSEKVSTCHNQVHLEPRDTDGQRCERHRVVVHPIPAEREKRLDYFGNHVEYFSILQPHTRLTVTSTSRIKVEAKPPVDLNASPPWESVAKQLRNNRARVTLDARQFIYGSPRVPLRGTGLDTSFEQDVATPDATTEQVRSYANESFTPNRPIAAAARDLTRRIHADFVFDANSTTLNTPLETAFSQRRGVCQDFSHVQIACLRALGLAARYVSGYLRTEPPKGQPRLVGADMSHAWVSVYCGQQGWVDFDPTNDIVPSDCHVTVGWGRDYNDICPVQGVFLGGGQHSMNTSVEFAVL